MDIYFTHINKCQENFITLLLKLTAFKYLKITIFIKLESYISNSRNCMTYLKKLCLQFTS
jgi:hypothetical protein